MHRMRARWLLLVVLPAPAGCSDPTPCIPGTEYAIVVAMRPTVPEVPTGTAFGVIREAGYADSLRFQGRLGGDPAVQAAILAAGPERPGSYDVSIRRSGFADWDTTGIMARAGSCHVETVNLSVILEPAP